MQKRFVLAGGGAILAILIAVIIFAARRPEAPRGERDASVPAVLTSAGSGETPESRNAEPSAQDQTGNAAEGPLEPVAQEAASTPAPGEIPEAIAQSETPAWTVIVPLAPGKGHTYSFILDGNKVPDKLNTSAKDIFGQNQFSIPPDADHSAPQLLPGNRGQFFYEGPVKMRLWLEPEWRGGVWSMDEFQPANEAARKNLREILADKSLSSQSGVVIDENRKPIPKARARAVSGFNHQATVECDGAGRFVIDRLPLAELAFSAHFWGYQDAEWVKSKVLPNGQSQPIELVMKKAVVFTGTVRDEMGKPVVRAAVAAGSKIPPFLGYPTVYTDAAGHYVHAHLPSEKYDLIVKHPDYAPAIRTGYAAEAGKDPIQVDFVLTQGGNLEGKVVQEVGGVEQPAAGVQVMLGGEPPAKDTISAVYANYALDGMSKEDGTFSIAHVPDQMHITGATAKKGSIEAQQPLDITYKKGDKHDPIVIQLPPESRLTGRVVDGKDQPVAGAAICIAELLDARSVYVYIDLRDKEKSKKATSDGEGKFTVEGVATGGKVRLQAEKEGFAPTKTEQMPTSTESEILIRMTVGGSISGRVVLADGKQPLAGAKVQTRQANYDGPYSQNAPKPEAISKEDGTFELANLPAGQWHLGGEWSGPEGVLVIEPKPNIQSIEGKRTENIELVAQAGLKIRGKVLYAETKEPVPTAQVQVGRKQENGQEIYSNDQGLSLRWYGQTNAAGEFDYGNVAPGKYSIMAMKEGTMRSEPREIVVEKGKNLEGIEILLGLGGSITGIVLSEADKPVSQTQVQAEMERDPTGRYWHDTYQTRTTSDKNGKFTITGIPLDKGSFRVVTGYGEKKGYGESEYVKITSEKPTAEVVVKLRGIAGISGSVKTKDGKPVAMASVRATIPNPQSGSSYVRSASTDAQGKYTIPELSPVENQVEVNKEGYAKATQRIVLKAGETTALDFVLEPSQPLKGVLVDLNMKKLAGWRVQATTQGNDPQSQTYLGDTTTGSEGRFRLDGLGMGQSVRLNFYDDRNRAYGGPNANYRNCSFRSGAVSPSEKEQPFVLSLGGVIKGRVLYEGSNKPATDAKISCNYKQSGPPAEPQGTQCVLQYAQVNAAMAVGQDGRFEIADLPVGAYVVNFVSEASAQKSLDDVLVDTSMLADLKDIYLAAGCVITGRLVVAATGQPLATTENQPYEVHVMFKDASGARGSANRLELDRATGRFKFGGIAPGAPSCVLVAIGYLPTPINTAALNPGKPLDLGDVRLEAGETVRGKLTGPKGEPAVGAQVVVMYQYDGEESGSMSQTNEKGEFSITGLVPGPATLRAFVQANARNSWVDSQSRMAQIQKHEFTVAPGGRTFVEAKFPAPAQPTPTPAR